MFTVILQFLSGAPFTAPELKPCISLCFSVRRRIDVGYYPVPAFPHNPVTLNIFFRRHLWNLSIVHLMAEAVPVCSASCSKRQNSSSSIWENISASGEFISLSVNKKNCYEEQMQNLPIFITFHYIINQSHWLYVLRGPAPATSRWDKAQAVYARGQWTVSRLKHIYAHVP